MNRGNFAVEHQQEAESYPYGTRDLPHLSVDITHDTRMPYGTKHLRVMPEIAHNYGKGIGNCEPEEEDKLNCCGFREGGGFEDFSRDDLRDIILHKNKVIADLEEHAYGSASWIETLNKGLKKAKEIKDKVDKKPPKESDADFRKRLEGFDKDKDAPTEAWGADELNGDGLFDDIKEGLKQREKDALAKWNKMSPQEKLRYEIQENIATLGEERAKWFNKSLYEKLAKLEGGAAAPTPTEPKISPFAASAAALQPIRTAIQNGIGDAIYGKEDDPKKQRKGLLGISEEGKEESKKKVMKNIVVPIAKVAMELKQSIEDSANQIFNPDKYESDMKERKLKANLAKERENGVVRDKNDNTLIVRKPRGLYRGKLTSNPQDQAYGAFYEDKLVPYVRVPNPLFGIWDKINKKPAQFAGTPNGVSYWEFKKDGIELPWSVDKGKSPFNDGRAGTIIKELEDEFIFLPEEGVKEFYAQLVSWGRKELEKTPAGQEQKYKKEVKEFLAKDPRTLKGEEARLYYQVKEQEDKATVKTAKAKVEADIKAEEAKANPDMEKLAKMKAARERVIQREKDMLKAAQQQNMANAKAAYLADQRQMAERKAAAQRQIAAQEEAERRMTKDDKVKRAEQGIADIKKIIATLQQAGDNEDQIALYNQQLQDLEEELTTLVSESVKQQAQGSVDLLQQAQVVGGAKPCWKGYEMIGMKQKGKRTVPNCVPIGGEGGEDDDDDDDDEEVEKEEVEVDRIDMGKGLVYLVDAPKKKNGKRLGLPFASFKIALGMPVVGIGNRRVWDAETKEEVGILSDPIFKKLAMKVYKMEEKWRQENLDAIGDELGVELGIAVSDDDEDDDYIPPKHFVGDGMEGSGAVEYTLQKAGKPLFNPSGDMSKAGRQSFTPDYDAYGATVADGRKNAFNLSRSMYDQSKAIELPDFKMIKDDTSLRFYKKEDENVILVGIRGTDVKSWTDLYTWAVIGANQDLRMTTRFQEDLAKMVAFQRNYPPSQFYYVAVGSSLAGSIADRFLELGLIEEAITYNPSIEKKYVLDESILNHRVYLDTDPLFMLMGQYAPNTEIRVNPNKTNYYNPSKEKDYLIASHSIYPIYNPAFEGGGMEGSGKTYTIEEWKAIFDAKLEEKRKAIEAREAKKKQTAKAKRERAKARRDARDEPPPLETPFRTSRTMKATPPKEPEPEEEEPEVEVEEYEMGDETYLVEVPRKGLAFAERRVFDSNSEEIGNLTEDDVGKTLVKMVMRREKLGAFADKSPKAKSSSESLPSFESKKPKEPEPEDDDKYMVDDIEVTEYLYRKKGYLIEDPKGEEDMNLEFYANRRVFDNDEEELGKLGDDNPLMKGLMKLVIKQEFPSQKDYRETMGLDAKAPKKPRKQRKPEPEPEEEESDWEEKEWTAYDLEGWDKLEVENASKSKAFGDRWIVEDGAMIGTLREYPSVAKKVEEQEKRELAKAKKPRAPKAPASARVELREELVAEQPRSPSGEFAKEAEPLQLVVSEVKKLPQRDYMKLMKSPAFTGAERRLLGLYLSTPPITSKTRTKLMARSGLARKLMELLGIDESAFQTRKDRLKIADTVEKRVATKKAQDIELAPIMDLFDKQEAGLIRFMATLTGKNDGKKIMLWINQVARRFADAAIGTWVVAERILAFGRSDGWKCDGRNDLIEEPAKVNESSGGTIRTSAFMYLTEAEEKNVTCMGFVAGQPRFGLDFGGVEEAKSFVNDEGQIEERPPKPNPNQNFFFPEMTRACMKMVEKIDGVDAWNVFPQKAGMGYKRRRWWRFSCKEVEPAQQRLKPERKKEISRRENEKMKEIAGKVGALVAEYKDIIIKRGELMVKRVEASLTPQQKKLIGRGMKGGARPRKQREGNYPPTFGSFQDREAAWDRPIDFGDDQAVVDAHAATVPVPDVVDLINDQSLVGTPDTMRIGQTKMRQLKNRLPAQIRSDMYYDDKQDGDWAGFANYHYQQLQLLRYLEQMFPQDPARVMNIHERWSSRARDTGLYNYGYEYYTG